MVRASEHTDKQTQTQTQRHTDTDTDTDTETHTMSSKGNRTCTPRIGSVRLPSTSYTTNDFSPRTKACSSTRSCSERGRKGRRQAKNTHTYTHTHTHTYTLTQKKKRVQASSAASHLLKALLVDGQVHGSVVACMHQVVARWKHRFKQLDICTCSISYEMCMIKWFAPAIASQSISRC